MSNNKLISIVIPLYNIEDTKRNRINPKIQKEDITELLFDVAR